jgi:Flp pilus assembly protein CpaB
MTQKIILAAAFLLTLMACVLTNSYRNMDEGRRILDESAFVPTSTPIPMVLIVIAIQDIPAGTWIDPSMIAQVFFPLDSAPRGAYTALEYVVAKYAITDIYQEEIILARKITDNSEYSGYGATLSVIVASQDLEAGIVLAEEDIFRVFYDRNSIDVFEVNGYAYDADDLVYARTNAIGKTLNIALRQFEPIPLSALSGGE